MRTLYLHIGFHKTGSSSLQLALKRYQSGLLSRGYEFVSLGKKGNSSGAIAVQKSGDSLQFELGDRFEQLLKMSRGERVIVSAEHFSFLCTPAQIEQVASVCTRYFDDIRVIVYLRRQDRQAISFKQQGARGCERDRSSSSRLLGHSEGAFPALTDAVKTYYDYTAKLELWERSFGREALQVREFSAGRLSGGDIVTDFAALLDGKIEIPACRVNEGITRKEFLLTHKLIELGVAPGDIEKLKPLMATDGGRLRPARATAMKFLRQFEASNRRLDGRYLSHPSGRAFDDDFSGYPERGNDRIDAADLEKWSCDLFAAGLRDPAGTRDLLLADHLRSMAAAGEIGDRLRGELLALSGCLLQTAARGPAGEPWYRRLRRKKRGR